MAAAGTRMMPGQWERADNPYWVVRSLPGNVPSRRFRFAGAAILRAIPDEFSLRHHAQAWATYLEGGPPDWGRPNYDDYRRWAADYNFDERHAGWSVHWNGRRPWRWHQIVLVRGVGTLERLLDQVCGIVDVVHDRGDLQRDYDRRLCSALREVFPGPVWPKGPASRLRWSRCLAPAWRTSTVTALARQAWGSRDFSVMPILADALQDAGCDGGGGPYDDRWVGGWGEPWDALKHLRGPGPHCRGCWVLDQLVSPQS